LNPARDKNRDPQDRIVDFLARRWFLLLLLAGVSLAIIVPGWLQPWTQHLSPRLIVGGALFLMAWGLESRSLFRAVARPWPALWAVAVSYGLLPVLAWAAGGLLLEPYRIGLLIMASVPCTLASAILWTRIADGNDAVALLITMLTTCTSWLVTPAWLGLTTGIGAAVSLNMMSGLALSLVAPVALGQASRMIPVLARAATRCRTLLDVIARLLVLCILLKATVDVRVRLAMESADLTPAALLMTAAVGVGVHLSALFSGLMGSKLWRFERASQVAVAFGCSQKTLPVALFLFDEYFKDRYPLALVSLVFYHLGQLVLDTFIADGFKGRHASESKPEAMANL
jgi:solute carrier family 10 (sodium/bile acid cotransporter), member 7